MKPFKALLLLLPVLVLIGCASRNEAYGDCCSQRETVFVDKPVGECTRAVQRVVQTSPCAACERFPVAARFDGECVR